MRGGGPGWLKSILDNGDEPSPEDLPPSLGWEHPVWDWYERLRAAVHRSKDGKPIALDRAAWWPVIDRESWNAQVAIRLVDALDAALFSADAERPLDDPDPDPDPA